MNRIRVYIRIPCVFLHAIRHALCLMPQFFEVIIRLWNSSFNTRELSVKSIRDFRLGYGLGHGHGKLFY